MKICHFADSHLGAGSSHRHRGSTGLTRRQEDMVAGFTEAVSRIIDIGPDLCLYAGDIFDAVRPSNRIIALAGEQLHRLAEQSRIPTVIIAGNHDAPKQTHYGAALEIFKRIDNLFVACDGKLEKFSIGEAVIYALPHCLTTADLKDELEKCLPDSDSRYNILMMHGVAAGMPEFSMADLGEQELPLEVMERFDYTALGHFHNSCKVGKRAWYSGSTERLSQSERNAAKGFLEVDLEPLKVRFHEVPTRTMVDLPVISAAGKRGDELAMMIKTRLEELDSSDKIVRLKIEDVSEETLKTIPSDLMSDLKQKSFSLNISFEKDKDDGVDHLFGRAGIGKLDVGFIEFLETADLKGFDRDRLKELALKYLAVEE